MVEQTKVSSLIPLTYIKSIIDFRVCFGLCCTIRWLEMSYILSSNHFPCTFQFFHETSPALNLAQRLVFKCVSLYYLHFSWIWSVKHWNCWSSRMKYFTELRFHPGTYLCYPKFPSQIFWILQTKIPEISSKWSPLKIFQKIERYRSIYRQKLMAFT